MSNPLIGHSLSLCVADIIQDRVRLENVAAIISNTAARDARDWDKVIESYCATYWRSDAGRARRVVQYLRDANRISQPRLVHAGYSRALVGVNAHWEVG